MDDKIKDLLLLYGIERPEVTRLRHNENRTYSVTDTSDGNVFLLRVHDPVTVNMAGIQHTSQGIEAEMQLLEQIAKGIDHVGQRPVRSLSGQLVTEIEADGGMLNCSMLRWIEGRNMTMADLSTHEAAHKLGARAAELHAFFDTCDQVKLDDRPDYGIGRTEQMLNQIRRGVELELFSKENFATVEKTVALIIERLKSGCPEAVKMGMIHADLNMSNLLVTPLGEFAFIDYSLFGFGYRLLDVAMLALNAPKETREQVVKGYFGWEEPLEGIYPVIEGFMLSAIFGYYAFAMENEAVHPWITERMPQLCKNRCLPFLEGERIFFSF